MSNPLMGGMPNNPMQMLAQLKQNPLAVLQKAGFNVPSNINSPQEITQYLMNSGQISQEQYNKARELARQFGAIK